MFFIDLMNRTFHGRLNRFVLVFIDDILVHSKNDRDHEVHLGLMSEILRQHKLKAKFSKKAFLKTKC